VLRAVGDIAGAGGEPADGPAWRLVQEELLGEASAASNEMRGPTIAALGLWLAFNHPRGGYREGVAEILRRHGRAHLCVRTDARGLAWGFVVADQSIDLAPLLAQALSSGEEASIRTLERAGLN
jgi:hypothetical protein